MKIKATGEHACCSKCRSRLSSMHLIADGPGFAALQTKLASFTSRSILDVHMSAMGVLRQGEDATLHHGSLFATELNVS
jgi:hypothetical protein